MRLVKPLDASGRLFVPVFVLTLVWGCSRPAGDAPSDPGVGTSPPATGADMRRDVHSHARPDEVAVTHLDLDLDVDFETHQLSGRASLAIDNKAGAAKLHLDTHGLEVRGVTLDSSGEPARFELGEPDEVLGRELTIDVAPDTATVHVSYSTDPEAKAVLWLAPEQTAGGRHPFLFTQSQAILARTWVPCQDTPGVRMTYDATVRVPAELMAVMSAENATEKSADGVYRFHMPQPIPSYLLALAVGDLEFRSIGARSGVYAEPSVVDEAAWEFAGTEDMIEAVEELYGPYLWGRYDVLVLPPSFPLGGMENPRLTFATPTILAGDRSLVSLIAHELAHSWSGNLVTNATWNDFWLNEGFTVYLERRIMEVLQGRDYADMLALLGRQDLESAIAELDAEDTRLHVDLTGRDADDSFTDIPYEKGYFFLRMIEEAVGRERFDPFLRGHFESNPFESVTTADFVDYLRRELVAGDDDLEEKLRIDDWVYAPGLPDNAPNVVSDAFARVEAEVAAWTEGKAAENLATGAWTTHEWLHFLRSLPGELTADQMADLDGAFAFTATGNSEILHAWLHHVIHNGYEAGYQALEDFLTGMGRRKFLKPLYELLAKTDDGLIRARRIYEEARGSYHSMATGTIDEILGWPY